MEKILIALEGAEPNREILSFGTYLSRLTRSRITGVFLENQVENERSVAQKMYDGSYTEWEVAQNAVARKEKVQQIEKSIGQFKAYYANHDIPTVVHHDKGVPVDEMLRETRFADLLVVDAGYSCTHALEKIPTAFVEEMLTRAECPIVIAPIEFDGVEEVVFAWDGSRSATFAVKLFTYLFPQLSDKKAIIVHVKEGKEGNVAGRTNMQEWMEHHYTTIQWDELTGEADVALFEYFLKKRKAFIVFGAYGRNQWSRFFRHSHAEDVIRTIPLPIFIAHH